MMNLPNSITVGRILTAPFIAALPFIASPGVRLFAFVLYIAAAVTDYYDGKLARTRGLVTDIGRMLDPLADKLLLFATLIPMFVLMAPVTDRFAPALATTSEASSLPFITPLGQVGLPWWILAIVIGREIFMTLFRQFAAWRGVVIGAIGPAKWKTGFQCTWVGSAYFWFFASTLATRRGWTSAAWTGFAYFNGFVGSLTMVAAVFLTLYSLLLY
ncbi:MAG: CDP-alcohol phosphatidyltransferase family protein, partial [Gemmatimonadaceae bacterium]|nr:CDP-alcohol phosphatidyltransferase family protein [Gemmatimonadaceae bacterium]